MAQTAGKESSKVTPCSILVVVGDTLKNSLKWRCVECVANEYFITVKKHGEQRMHGVTRKVGGEVRKGIEYTFLFCFVLFCFVLFCFVLFCFVLFCFVLFCFVLFCFVLFCFVLFCFILFCFVRFDSWYSARNIAQRLFGRTYTIHFMEDEKGGGKHMKHYCTEENVKQELQPEQEIPVSGKVSADRCNAFCGDGWAGGLNSCRECTVSAQFPSFLFRENCT